MKYDTGRFDPVLFKIFPENDGEFNRIRPQLS